MGKTKSNGQVFFALLLLATSVISFINFMRHGPDVLSAVTFFITFVGGITVLYIALVWSKRKIK